MIPKASQGVGHIVTRIAMDMIPKAPDAYMATDLGYLTALLSMIGQDFDRGADALVTDISGAEAILREAAPQLGDAPLAVRIAGVLGGKAKSLRLPDLNERSDLVLGLLIEVHGRVEAAAAGGAAWAKAMDAEIWRFLEGHVERHAYQVGF